MTEEKVIKNPPVITEVMNAITHGLGVLFSIIGTVLLLMKNIQTPEFPVSYLIAAIVYGTSMTLLFLSSTLYHALSYTRARDIMQKIDHAMIYMFIAGSYTPYLTVIIDGAWKYVGLAVIWLIAIIGIVFEVGWTNRFPKLSTILYLVMGWMGVLYAYPIIQNLPLPGLILLVISGLTYTLGTYFYKQKDKPWMHVIWHLFVLAAAFLMYCSIYFYVYQV